MSDTNSAHLYEQDAGPFAQAAWAYHNSGWSPMPLPAGRKSPPPGRYTGWAGVAPSGADIQAWLDEGRGAGNIGLTLRGDIIGIDVDAYGGKDGEAALAELTARAGEPLPDTWISTSRTDGVSGIRMFRASVPDGRVWIDEPGGTGRGVEMIHRGHRYVVAWPSIHPSGGTYRWLGTDGVPVVAGLPELPAAWVEVLSRPGEVTGGSAAGHTETLAAVDGWAVGPACGRVQAELRKVRDALSRADREALHPAGKDQVWSLTCLAYEGHHGVREALAVHHEAFLHARGDVRSEGRQVAQGEWWRMVRGAVGKVAPTYPDGPAAADPCTASAFDPGIAPGSLPAPTTVSEVSDADPFGPPSSTATGDDTSSPAEGGSDGGEPVDLVAQLLARMLDRDALDALPPVRPLVEGLLDLDSESWIIGPAGGFKSFVALDLACHVSGGRMWQNRPVHRGPVVYVAAEGAKGLKGRVRAWEATYGQRVADLYFLPEPVQVSDGVGWRVLAEACRRIGPSLIVLDTQARITVGLDENSNGAMGVLVEAVRLLRVSTGACVLVVHHTGRNGADARGASAIDGAQDTEIRVSRPDGKGMAATIRLDKQKDGDDTLEVGVTLRVVDLGACPVTGRALSSLAIVPYDPCGAPSVPRAKEWIDKLTENQAAIIDVVREHFATLGGTKAEVKAVVNERFGGRWTDGVMPKASFATAWDRLADVGMLARIKGTQRFALAPPPAVPAGNVVAGLSVPDEAGS